MLVDIGIIQRMTAPSPFALVSTTKEDGGTNLMALSWWCYASNHPPAVVVCLSKKGYSGELILRNREFGLNLVDASIAQAAMKCGRCSGRNVDKPSAFSIELLEPEVIATKLVKAHSAALECRLIETADAADHTVYIAEIVGVHVFEHARPLFAFDGYTRLDTVD